MTCYINIFKWPKLIMRSKIVSMWISLKMPEREALNSKRYCQEGNCRGECFGDWTDEVYFGKLSIRKKKDILILILILSLIDQVENRQTM